MHVLNTCVCMMPYGTTQSCGHVYLQSSKSMQTDTNFGVSLQFAECYSDVHNVSATILFTRSISVDMHGTSTI